MAVKGGRKDAYFYMGEIYRYKNRIGEAVQCYNLAMENGNLSAALPLGWFYEQGIGVEKCEEKAFELYQQAYEDGNPDSIFYLGRMHYLGKGTEENDAKMCIRDRRWGRPDLLPLFTLSLFPLWDFSLGKK